MFSALRSKLFRSDNFPTVVHLTHPKAGSTWITKLLHELFPRNVAARGKLVAKASDGDLSKHRFEKGWIYPALFMSRDAFLSHPELQDARRFVVIRDPRDTLVSLYFSLKYSHALENIERRKQARDELQDLSVEEGLAFLIENRGNSVAQMQRSWLSANEPILRYEDLILRDAEIFGELLNRTLNIPVAEDRLQAALEKCRFENVFKRKIGEVDINSHGRQGLPGDWKNHFTPPLRKAFHAKHGDLLISAGYERDSSWADEA
jgi:hypothetical protein